eukprot:scaffold57866_cov52-Prasinocladus_malaysianus.AAC.1
MNTDARRAVFCCVMGADDYMDAFERLLRLPLKAQQEREIVRVVVECCLQVRPPRTLSSHSGQMIKATGAIVQPLLWCAPRKARKCKQKSQ